MPILPIRLEAVAHIPHGSGDAEYHLIDADADNSDVLAIIDPHMILPYPDEFAERLALASNSHDALVTALQTIVNECTQHAGEITRLQAAFTPDDMCRLLCMLADDARIAVRLGTTGQGRDLHIDGTCDDDTLQSGLGGAPFYVFDADAQANIAGPFNTHAEAEAALIAARDSRS